MYRHGRVAIGIRTFPRGLEASHSFAGRRLQSVVAAHRHVHTSTPRHSHVRSSRNDFGNYGIDIIAGFSKNDTIYALSSAQGRAGIAVIRVSGPACLDVYQKLCPSKQLPKPRYAAVRTLHDPENPDAASILDSGALVLYFPSPKTVTGEDVLELHTHGGPATVKAVLGAIPRCSAGRTQHNIIRYAEPGEFTKRAFLNDRLDLSQVESLSDVLDAETEQQRRAAVRGNSGARGQTYDAWRGELLLARGEIEALIDFSEDQHFDESPRELLRNVTAMVQRILRSIDVHEMAGQRTELLRKGVRIALLGPPNVGKSSLMNLIVGREASIVSREAGTTRDIVEASLDIGGYLCTFADTAGIRTSALSTDGVIGPIEEEGIRRARLKALGSDVIVVLASVERHVDGTHFINYDAETLQLASKAEQHIIVVNKCDSVDRSTLEDLLKDFGSSVHAHVEGLAEPRVISCKKANSPSESTDKDPGGIHSLTQNLVHSFENLTSLPEDMQDLIGGTERQRQLLAQCRLHLEDFMGQAEAGDPEPEAEDLGDEPDIVLAAEHLRFAANCLARITGRGDAGDVEEVLGVIFEKYYAPFSGFRWSNHCTKSLFANELAGFV
ncbi:mitochondrial splicing system protein [Diaporthe australafricana]|uniref:Mitochondrial splicing system protein n=1 Tax=Diaporthe australafricana TaxID=127596 RepID=A0ABR3WI94_9PEZI